MDWRSRKRIELDRRVQAALQASEPLHWRRLHATRNLLLICMAVRAFELAGKSSSKASKSNLPMYYTSVAVLLIHWAEELNPDLKCGSETAELETLFREQYGFATRTVILDCRHKLPQPQLNLEMARFVHEYDGPHLTNLLIVYYSGSGRLERKQGSDRDQFQICGGNGRPMESVGDCIHEPVCDWESAESILYHATADILTIIDSCYAASSADKTIATSGHVARSFETIAATASMTERPGTRSFTNALMVALSRLAHEVKETQHTPFDTWRLYERLRRIRGRQGSAMPLLFNRNEVFNARHICLAPVSSLPAHERQKKEETLPQQKEEAAHAEIDRELTITISPKDALLDHNDTDQVPLLEDVTSTGAYNQRFGGTEHFTPDFFSQGNSNRAFTSGLASSQPDMTSFRATNSADKLDAVTSSEGDGQSTHSTMKRAVSGADFPEDERHDDGYLPTARWVDDATTAPGECSVRDSGYGSRESSKVTTANFIEQQSVVDHSESDHYPRVAAEESSDTDSIKTDGRDNRLPMNIRDSLVSEFVEQLLFETNIKAAGVSIEQDSVLQAIQNTLKDFTLLLETSALDETANESITFVRHQRGAIVREFVKTIKAELFRANLPQSDIQPTSSDRVQILFLQDTLAVVTPQDEIQWTPPEEISCAPSLAAPVALPKHVPDARRFLLEGTQFLWLRRRIHQLTSLLQTGSEYCNVQGRLAEMLRSMQSEDELVLSLDWVPKTFLVEQSRGRHFKISDVLVYCGSGKTHYGTTTIEYASLVWPALGQKTVRCFDDTCSGLLDGNSDGIVDSSISGATLAVELHENRTIVRASGQVADVLEIAEVAVWLATACRANSAKNCAGTCSASLDFHGKQQSSKRTTWSIHQSINLNALPAQSDGSCWLNMLRNPVIATGYPIPQRDASGQQVGLEVGLGWMVALSHANWATTYDGLFMLKGLISALFPILDVCGSIVWHFLIKESGFLNGEAGLMHCEVASAPGANRLIKLTPDDLEHRRHFVGLWTTSGQILAGSTSEDATANFRLSRSKVVDEYRLSPTTFTISAAKIVGAGLTSNLAKKDIAPAHAYVEQRPYPLQIKDASSTKVLLYGTEDRRGWLLDGATVLAYMMKAFMQDEENDVHPDARTRLVYVENPKGHEARFGGREARDVLKANQSIPIYHNYDHKQKKTISEAVAPHSNSTDFDSAYESGISFGPSSQAKHEVETVRSETSYGTIALSFWRTLDAMRSKMWSVKQENVSVPLKVPKGAIGLLGWDIVDIMTGNGPIEARKVELKQRGEKWTKFARETGTIVLFARTFGDVILPASQTATCVRACPVPKGYDLLAVPLYVWKARADRFSTNRGDCFTGCIQVDDKVYWHGVELPNDGPHYKCTCATGVKCNILSRLGNKDRPKKSEGKVIDFFEEYPRGVALIGGRARLFKKVSGMMDANHLASDSDGPSSDEEDHLPDVDANTHGGKASTNQKSHGEGSMTTRRRVEPTAPSNRPPVPAKPAILRGAKVAPPRPPKKLGLRQRLGLTGKQRGAA